MLAQYFMSRYGQKIHQAIRIPSPRTLDILTRYDWPGNVRELENICERAVILCSSEIVDPHYLPFGQTTVPTKPAAPEPDTMESLDEVERKHILAVLQACRGNRTESSRRLGIAQATLWRKLKSYGM